MITIEQMLWDDLNQVLEIEEASFSSPWSRTAFEMEIGGENRYAYYLVARDGDRVVGYLGAWFIVNEAHITNIAVRPTHRRRGIGELLLDYFFKKAVERDIDAVTLEVRVSNHHAQNLYWKMGFKDMGVRPKYYQDNQEDALIMWKVLNEG
jgi:ribosomal-protein-alanine N-acetyltransferase